MKSWRKTITNLKQTTKICSPAQIPSLVTLTKNFKNLKAMKDLTCLLSLVKTLTRIINCLLWTKTIRTTVKQNKNYRTLSIIWKRTMMPSIRNKEKNWALLLIMINKQLNNLNSWMTKTFLLIHNWIP